MQYVKVINNIPVSLMAKPKWFDNEGNKIDDDAAFIADGIYPLEKATQSYDQMTEKFVINDMSQWLVLSDRVVETGEIISLPVDKIKKNQRESLKATRDATINAPLNGFDVDTPETRENIEGAIDYYDILTSNGTVDLVWTMADNSTQVVTKADLQGAKDGYVIRKAQAFKTYQQEVSKL